MTASDPRATLRPMLNSGWLFALALTGPAWSGAEDDDAHVQEAREQALTPEEELDAAIVQYLSGEMEAARLALIRLASDPRLEEEILRQRVRLYLGEVQYVMGEQQAAWSTFLAVLLEEPTFRMDPFVHPPDVIAYFESVREYAARFKIQPPEEAPARKPDPPATPNLLLIAVPGGLQFFNEQNVLGYLSIVGFAGSSAAALSLRVHIKDQDIVSGITGVQVASDDERDRLENLRVWRNACLGITGAVWGLSVTQGMVRAYRRPAATTATLMMGPMSAGVTLRW